ncbi:RusA family crossover junction endodeoxyribonuclease [Fodinibius sp.]|uniref:RusA family crossover junction endodeoxyribonuclease n=1 Tax=Fodinibius sp. TaxID=1872440 RepID=UPI002ACEB2D0|nr:RusA family crossover junction endodeoxyribonuclease [Fodinibius sp.]MDZ7658040.1 RusA family crossover junction endodeoxyribonuclease [Fodinibius sp.]
MTDLEIFIPQQPFSQKRHRDGKTKSGKEYKYDPSASEKKIIKERLQFYKPPQPLTGPLVQVIEVYFQTPQSWSKAKQERHEGRYRPKTPDYDNIEKVYGDAMNGVIYKDDKQIVNNNTKKYYSMNPRTIIRITELEPIE